MVIVSFLKLASIFTPKTLVHLQTVIEVSAHPGTLKCVSTFSGLVGANLALPAQCSYLHDVPSPNGDIVNEIKVMQEELQFVTNALKTKEIEIIELKEKVNELENILMAGEFQQSKNEFKCNLCEYKCKSETVLKRHIGRKHKPETLSICI